MQVHTETTQITRGNVAGEHNFTIKASAKAFNILSSNLYSNKPLAIIRELCCNAYDSHVAAGCADRPIEIVLPTRLNGGQLIIKDFGTGLNHEQMISIYTKFFESTKTESNDFVGQLGLGSKSPFSMFKSFSIEARKDGVKRVYTAFLNEEGIPTIALMSTADTDEGNGVMVTMHVKNDDHDKFLQAAKQALMYFNPKPIVSGQANFATFNVKHGIGGSEWKVRESEYWARMSGPHVVQGFVVYPIDSSIIKDSGNLSPSARVIAGLSLDFWMPIGSVDVAPSREALSYDKRTIANIAAAFEKVADEMRVVIQKDLDTAATMWEAACKLYKHENEGNYEMRNLFESMHKSQAFTWKGKAIDTKMVLDTTKIKTTMISRAQSSGRKLQYSSRWEPHLNAGQERKVSVHAGVQVLVDDLTKGGGDIIKQFLDDSANNKSTVVILKAVKKDLYNQKEIDRIIKMLGNPEVKKVSALPYKASVKTSSGKGRSKEQRLQFTGFPDSGRWNDKRRVFSRLTWQAVDVDLTKGGFYLPLDRHAVINGNRVEDQLDSIINASVALGLISANDRDERLFGFSQKEIDAADPTKWVNFFDHVAAQFEAKNIAAEVVRANVRTQMDGHMADFNRHFGRYWDKYEVQLNDGSFKTFVNKIRAMNVRQDLLDSMHSINTFTRYVKTTTDINQQVVQQLNALREEWNDLLRAHGMLQHVSWYGIDSGNIGTIIEYINMVSAMKV